MPWLLDQGPSDLRMSPLRTMPEAMAYVLAHHLSGSLSGVRDAYRAARADLADRVTPAELEIVRQALEAQAAILVARQREVELVRQALQRRSTRAKRDHRLD